MVRSICLIFFLCLLTCEVGCTHKNFWWEPIVHEQRTIAVRDPEIMPRAYIPDLAPPLTVSDPFPGSAERPLSLDEAIRITLANSDVVRVLAGITAVPSGRTIYDPAISNTLIDQERAVFDPRWEVLNSFDRTETPQGTFGALGAAGAFFDPSLLVPGQPIAVVDPFDTSADARISGIRTDAYNLGMTLSKKTVTGANVSFNFTENLARFRPGEFPLNPQSRYASTLRLEQPLLQGAGLKANLAPVVVARINTERSYFQFKDAMQESVRGVIEAYWALVFARVDVWAREQQVEQGEFAFKRAEARQRQGFATAAEVAQARSALANFKAILIAAKANQIQREAALRNIMGLPPADGTHLVPVSPPAESRIEINWDRLLRLAEENRPDIIELKLIIEADQQLLIQANNQALPKVDAVGLYRWNGLSGTTPAGRRISTRGGEFTDWTLGVNFSLPLGLRRERAVLRQQELILARDWANLDQGMHQAAHDLATSTRNLAQFYEQYQAFKEARDAARINLEQQWAIYRVGGVKLDPLFFLNVLQAITDWGNAVSAEAQALAQYNTELATLERETGTILETHGVYFFEERFSAIGPLGRLARPCHYPSSLPPGPNLPRYPEMAQPAENVFDLEAPLQPKKSN